MTAFIHARIELAPGIVVVIDGNSKITAGNGSYAEPAPNAFSLPAASVEGSAFGACPGSTPTCRASCYVRGLAKHAPDVYAAYLENASALRALLHGHAAIALLAARNLGAWVSEHCADGFRWHVSGDVWGTEHARWIAQVCAFSPAVRHWIYTRTLEAVPELVRAPNLAVNVSADRDNAEAAIDVARKHVVRVAYMMTTERTFIVEQDLLRDGDVVFPDYPLRGRELADPTAAPYWQHAPHRLRVMTCPADFFGQSEQHRCGPCSRCMKPTGRP